MDKPGGPTPGVVGIGGGTGLLGLASLVPDDHPVLKAVLTYLAPTATVCIGLLWFVAIAAVRRWVGRRRITIALRDARAIRDAIFADPSASDVLRRDVQSSVETLERLAMALILAEAQALRTTLRDVAGLGGPA